LELDVGEKFHNVLLLFLGTKIGKIFLISKFILHPAILFGNVDFFVILCNVGRPETVADAERSDIFWNQTVSASESIV
jgi:hypothetical protein